MSVFSKFDGLSTTAHTEEITFAPGSEPDQDTALRAVRAEAYNPAPLTEPARIDANSSSPAGAAENSTPVVSPFIFLDAADANRYHPIGSIWADSTQPSSPGHSDVLPSGRDSLFGNAPPLSVSDLWQSMLNRASVKIPIVRFGKAADEDETETFKISDPIARNYLKAKNSIVTVVDSTYHVAGTGFFVASDGKLVTDNHVVEKNGDLKVITARGDVYDAHIIKTRPTADLAELQVDSSNPGEKFQALPIADSTQSLPLGTKMYAIGHPEGWPRVYWSPGEFSGYATRSEATVLNLLTNPKLTMLSSDMHTEDGNSGSPVIDSNGNVLGVVDYGSAYNVDLTPAEELHTLLGDGKSPPLKDYIVPRDLHVGGQTIVNGILGGLTANRLVQDARTVARNKTPGPLGLVANALFGLGYTFTDVPRLSEYMKTGTRAEKIDAGLDVTADAMMVSGTLGLVAPRLRVALDAVQLAGLGIKTVNDLFSDRKY